MHADKHKGDNISYVILHISSQKKPQQYIQKNDWIRRGNIFCSTYNSDIFACTYIYYYNIPYFIEHFFFNMRIAATKYSARMTG